MARSSLTDGIDIPDKSRGSSSSGGSGESLKVGLAIGCIVVGGLLIAWNFGAFDFVGRAKRNEAAKGHTLNPEQEKQIQKHQEIQKLPDNDPRKPMTAGG